MIKFALDYTRIKLITVFFKVLKDNDGIHYSLGGNYDTVYANSIVTYHRKNSCSIDTSPSRNYLDLEHNTCLQLIKPTRVLDRLQTLVDTNKSPLYTTNKALHHSSKMINKHNSFPYNTKFKRMKLNTLNVGKSADLSLIHSNNHNQNTMIHSNY